MTAANFIDFSATCRARILAAADTLGGIQQVLDRDEDPAILAKHSSDLPTVCVIPIGAGKLTVNLSMGGDDILEEFEQHIVAYYRFSRDNKTPYSDINVIRQYAKDMLALFTGQANMAFNNCVIYKATIEIKPYEEMDFVLDRFLLTLSVKTFEY